MPVENSRIRGLYKQTVQERLELVAKAAGLTDEHVQALSNHGELDDVAADRMIENVIGTMSLPVGVATNFVIDGKHYLVPFCLEVKRRCSSIQHGKTMPWTRRIHHQQRRTRHDRTNSTARRGGL